ncbi:hypothetical protein [Pseudodesulfovibrio portus]|uniref:Uncharacterized protein n=1 Tax=Pseudodesulfovibrio portus TaxID=231439 RepID=A0ABN6RYY4_9BACT|nr:hypothetical protein [Pseudodesulfovibrio portus]BDQ34705.1 hypothetical protein JCM14722_22470 [Pseudodesulfovibrio portus]
MALSYDTLCHLDYTKRIKKNNGRFLDTALRNRPYPFMYPYAYHALLARVPEQWMYRLEMGSSAFFDALSTLIVYHMTAWMSASNPTLFPDHAPLITALLFAFSPALVRIGSGPRSFAGTPRVMGEFIYLAHIALFQIAVTSGSYLAGAGSMLAGALLIITSKFGNQTLAFISIALAWFCTPLYLLFMAGSIALSVALFRKHPLLVIRGQIWHSIWYHKFYQHVFTGFGPRKFADYITSWKNHGLPKIRAKNLKGFLFWCLDEQYPVHLVVVCFTPLLFAFFAPTEALGKPDGGFLFGAFVGGVAACVITKMRFAMFLGEGERYLEHIMYPITVMAVMALHNHPVILWALVAYSMAMTVICLFRVPHLLSASQDKVLKIKEGVTALNNEPEGLVLPLGYTGYHALLWGNKPVIGLREEKEYELMPEEDFRALKAHLPLPTEDFSEVRRRFRPDYILTEKWAFDMYLGLTKDKAAFRDQLETILENDHVALFRVVGEQ